MSLINLGGIIFTFIARRKHADLYTYPQNTKPQI